MVSARIEPGNPGTMAGWRGSGRRAVDESSSYLKKGVVGRSSRFPVEVNVDLLVVEGDHSGDRLQLSGREVVDPGPVGMHGLADPDRPVPACFRYRSLRRNGIRTVTPGGK